MLSIDLVINKLCYEINKYSYEEAIKKFLLFNFNITDIIKKINKK